MPPQRRRRCRGRATSTRGWWGSCCSWASGCCCSPPRCRTRARACAGPEPGKVAARLRGAAGHRRHWRATPTSARQGQPVQRRAPATVPACQVARSEGSSTSASCASSPLVLTFLFDQRGRLRARRWTGSSGCGASSRSVNFAAVYFSGEEREEVAQIVRRRGWGDARGRRRRDGAVVNLYGVGVLPHDRVLRAGRQGPQPPSSGNLTEDELRAEVRRLAAGLSDARPRPRAGLGRRRAGRGVPGARALADRAWRPARAAARDHVRERLTRPGRAASPAAT